MSDEGSVEFNVEFGIEVFKLFVVELPIVVSDNIMRHAESVNYRFSYKFLSLRLGDLGH